MATPNCTRRILSSSSYSSRYQCLYARPRRRFLTTSARQLQPFQAQQYPDTTYPNDTPRWNKTPPQMRAPFRHRGPKTNVWTVNKSVRVLDEAYISFLGPDGAQMLSEEIKWLAVTHKSFEQGSRGFYDRLAYFGKRITDLQTSIALVRNGADEAAHAAQVRPEDLTEQDEVHAALKGLRKLDYGTKQVSISKGRMADLAKRTGVAAVVRWQPRYPDELDRSGENVVYATAVFAIIGAVALQRGGDVAARIVRERVLAPLGVL